jgi:hypothetical protein
MTEPMNALWSYAYARKTNIGQAVDKWGVPRVRLFADSGAHSARTLGIHIGVDDYADWLHRWHGHFTIYANLDVIFGPEATYRNQKALEDHGLSPMPVFHTGEPWSALERYLEEGYTYIALGKLLGNPWKKLAPWLAKAFRMADGQAVFHGFGLTAWPAIREFPFYSVDSSSWTSPYRFGTLRLFDRGRWVTVKMRDRDDVVAHRKILEDYKAPIAALTRTGFDRNVVGRLSAMAYIRAGEWVAANHGPITLPPGKGYPADTPLHRTAVRATEAERFHLYLAETTDWAHLNHANAIRRSSR